VSLHWFACSSAAAFISGIERATFTATSASAATAAVASPAAAFALRLPLCLEGIGLGVGFNRYRVLQDRRSDGLCRALRFAFAPLQLLALTLRLLFPALLIALTIIAAWFVALLAARWLGSRSITTDIALVVSTLLVAVFGTIAATAATTIISVMPTALRTFAALVMGGSTAGRFFAFNRCAAGATKEETPQGDEDPDAFHWDLRY